MYSCKLSVYASWFSHTTLCHVHAGIQLASKLIMDINHVPHSRNFGVLRGFSTLITLIARNRSVALVTIILKSFCFVDSLIVNMYLNWRFYVNSLLKRSGDYELSHRQATVGSAHSCRAYRYALVEFLLALIYSARELGGIWCGISGYQFNSGGVEKRQYSLSRQLRNHCRKQ